MSRGHCDALCGLRNAVCFTYARKKKQILIKKKTSYDSATHQGVVAQTVFEVLCCARSRILPNNIPDPPKKQKTEISVTYECNSETVGPGGTCNHSAGFLSMLRSFFFLGSTVTFKNWSYSSAETLASDSKPHCEHQSNLKSQLSKFICDWRFSWNRVFIWQDCTKENIWDVCLEILEFFYFSLWPTKEMLIKYISHILHLSLSCSSLNKHMMFCSLHIVMCQLSS